MDSTSIDLVGSKISEVRCEQGQVSVRLEPAYLVKTMTGSVERTRWWQNGWLVFDDAELEDASVLAELPAECAGGDVGENIYTYRDMLPVPLESAGQAHCDLKLVGSDKHISVRARSITLKMEEVPHYIEHIRPEEGSGS